MAVQDNFKLIDLLKHDFGNPLADLGFTELFGSVFAQLPKEAINKISGIEKLFFIFTPFPGAEVKTFGLEEGLSPGRLTIVNFPFDTAFMPFPVSRGMIAHELAHIYLGHERYEDEYEDEADELAKTWGFGKEIDELRNFEKDAYPKFEELKGGKPD